MTKRILNITAYIYVCIAFLCACTNDTTTQKDKSKEYQTEFLNQTEVGVIVKDKVVKGFDKTTDQLVATSDQKLFMISNMDNSVHCTVTFEDALYLEKSINIDYTSNGIPGLDNGTMEVTVVKIDAIDRRYWLWNNTLNTGFIVDFAL